jgi:hypothetical protein
MRLLKEFLDERDESSKDIKFMSVINHLHDSLVISPPSMPIDKCFPKIVRELIQYSPRATRSLTLLNPLLKLIGEFSKRILIFIPEKHATPLLKGILGYALQD